MGPPLRKGDVPETDPSMMDAYVRGWQQRLLPFMLGAVIFMSLFFLVVSLWVFLDFQRRGQDAALDLRPVFSDYEKAYLRPAGESSSEYLRWKTAALLEQELIARRYRQASSVVLARIWTRYLGFLTGMMLALVGAFFVLGQLRTDPSALQAEGQGLKAALTTSSPGLVLATLGSVLMAISLVVTFDFETRDSAVYLGGGPALARPPALMHESPPSSAPGRTPADQVIDAAPSAPATSK